MTVRIFDPQSNCHREVRDLHIAAYESGQVAEFTVIGKQHEWKLFIPLEEFKQANPGVTIQ